MGKGDKKSKRGKIIIGSFGVKRRKKSMKTPVKKADSRIKELKVKEKPKKVKKEVGEVSETKEKKEMTEVKKEIKPKAVPKKKSIE